MPPPAAADLTAPGYQPGAQHLPWPRRALVQGAGYYLPSTLFLAIPLLYTAAEPWPTFLGVALLAAVIGTLFLGSTLVLHWPEHRRWLWLAALLLAIVGMEIVSGGRARAVYFLAYVTTVAAPLIAWRHARVVIIGVSLAGLALVTLDADLLGVVMTAMGFSLGFSIGLGLDNDRTRRALRVAEERTAVLAVAAERERIGRDLHDILGHSLTAIAVKSDLAVRLVGRDDAAARAEVTELAAIARQALADVRATASGIREVRLATEIASARSVLEAAGIEQATPTALPLLADDRSELFGYVVREAVTNVVRHSGATHCTIAADEDSVTISDDGRGMPRGAARSGLAGLARRVADAGGDLEVTPGPRTTVRATLSAGVGT